MVIYFLSRVAYLNTPPQAERGMSDSALRYFPGALKPFCGEKLCEKKKSTIKESYRLFCGAHSHFTSMSLVFWFG